MIFNVEINSVFDSELEKDIAFTEVKLAETFNWDSVSGYLEMKESFINAESEKMKLKASLYDSVDVEEAILKISKNDSEEVYNISHNELESIMNQNQHSFIGAFKTLIEKYGA